jgi:hypothetical protein
MENDIYSFENKEARTLKLEDVLRALRSAPKMSEEELTEMVALGIKMMSATE